MNNIRFKLVVFLTLITGALGFCPGYLPFRKGEELMAQLAIIFFIAFFYIKNKWISIFLLWNIIRFFLGINALSIWTLHTTLFYVVLYQVLYDKFNKDNANIILDGICLIAIYQLFMMILQFIGIWIHIIPLTLWEGGTFKTYFERTKFSFTIVDNPRYYWSTVTGFTSNVTMASGLLAMCLPAFFRKKWWLWIPLVAAGLLSAKAMSGIFAAIIVSVIYTWVYTPKIRWQIISGLLAVMLVWVIKIENHTQLLNGNGRFEAWKFITSKLIPKRWIIGWGVGQAPALYPIIQRETSFKNIAWIHAHNEFINLWVEYGVIGFVIGMGYVFTLIKNGFINIAKNKTKFLIFLGVVSGLLNCQVSFPLHVTIGFLLVVYLAILDKLNQEEKCVI